MNEMLWAALVLGFMGSLHCVGMCGGLVGAFVMSRPDSGKGSLLIYQLGRVFTYTLLGIILGAIGGTLQEIGGTVLQSVLTGLVGVLIVLLGLNMIGLIPDPFLRLFPKFAGYLKPIQYEKSKKGSYGAWFSYGFINGLLPCGLVYAALGMALASEKIWISAGVMIFFGIGTIPSMMAAPALLRLMKPRLRGKLLKITGVLMVLYGLYTGLRGPVMMQIMHGGQSHKHSPSQMK